MIQLFYLLLLLIQIHHFTVDYHNFILPAIEAHWKMRYLYQSFLSQCNNENVITHAIKQIFLLGRTSWSVSETLCTYTAIYMHPIIYVINGPSG